MSDRLKRLIAENKMLIIERDKLKDTLREVGRQLAVGDTVIAGNTYYSGQIGRGKD